MRTFKQLRNVTPAKAGVQLLYEWIPASAGMTILINDSMGPSKIPASAGMTFRQLEERTFKLLEERTFRQLEERTFRQLEVRTFK